ncbi:MAG: nuclease A inhibitor family protein [Myxococcota bacterium]
MTRIAKKDIHAALNQAAQNIIAAGGSDGRISRADMKAKLKELDGTEKKLTDMFFRFVDHRDFKTGSQVTPSNVKAAVEYAKEHMVNKYDLNNNGLSADEVARMSVTGRLAVNLARALKEAGAVSGSDDNTGKLSAEKLGRAIAPFTQDAVYMSEGDYNPEFFSVKLDANATINGKNVMAAMNDTLASFFDQQDGDLSQFTFEAYTAQESKDFVDGLSETSPDDDDDIRESAAAFGKITALLQDNLTGIKVFKIGPKDDDGSLATDRGLYAQVVVGRSADGKLTGIILGDVET